VNRLQRLLPFVTLILLAIALTIATPHFLTALNLASVARQTAVINLLALGMTLVIITGGIDLSVGSMLALAGLFGSAAFKSNHSIVESVAIGMSVGLLCGLLNGVMITQLRISPFIVTLGTLEAYRGLALVKSKGLPVHDIPDSFSFLGDGNLLGIPFSLWVLAGCAVGLDSSRSGGWLKSAYLAAGFGCSGGAAGLTNFASSTGTFCLSSLS